MFVINTLRFALLVGFLTVQLAHGHACYAQELDPTAMRAELQRLAGVCDELGLKNEATQSAAWLDPSRDKLQCLYLPVDTPIPVAERLVESVGESGRLGATQTVNQAAARGSWLKHFRAARAAHARWLFSQATQRAADGDEAEAFLLLWQVLREDAQHPQANRILGPLASAAQVKPRLRTATTTHPDFGWPAGSYSRIETPNFLITTRAAPRESLEMALAMEQFYALWRQVFFPLWARPGALTQRFEGRNIPWEKSREIQVVLLRDRADYLQTLGVSEKNAAISVGYYEPQMQKSFFYAADGWQATLFHELTHQLLAEATNIGAAPQAGASAGIWLIEGIALYMESLTNRGSYWTLGGDAAPRLQTARYRAVRDGYWVEWNEFTQAGREQWKQDSQISLLYTQATGLSHLFMDQLQQPAARQAMFQALVGVYQNSADFEPLRKLLGEDDAGAKLAYQNALILSDEQVNEMCAARLPCTSLVLAGSELTPATWRKLAELTTNMEWFDASFSNATSGDLQWLSQAKKLQRLSVEGTHCDSDVLKLLKHLPALSELDLTGCDIDDQGLREISEHPALEILWLDGTRTTTAARETLSSLPKLKVCHSEAIGWTRIPQP